ncbi:MAG: InlB B-repeat-containing protein, partial [Peptoniphilus sp.]|nr:InlB B-repeat-containing protein [Peptoniphilus sp.]
MNTLVKRPLVLFLTFLFVIFFTMSSALAFAAEPSDVAESTQQEFENNGVNENKPALSGVAEKNSPNQLKSGPELLPLGRIKPQITDKEGRTTADFSKEYIDGIDFQNSLIMPFTYEDWTKIRFRVFDMNGTELVSETTGNDIFENATENNDHNKLKFAKELGAFKESDKIVLEVISDSIPDGYHLTYASSGAYTYGGYPSGSYESLFQPMNKFSMALQKYNYNSQGRDVLVAGKDIEYLETTWIYFALFDVHFDPSTGINIDDSQDIVKNGTIDGSSAVVTNRIQKDNSLVIPTPTKEGYKFLYWKADSTKLDPENPQRYSRINFSKIVGNPSWVDVNTYEYVNKRGDCEATFYPVWKKVHTVTFDSAGGTSVDPQKVVHGETATAPENPKKKYAKFLAWTLDNAAFNFNTPVTKDITLTAKWEDYTLPTTKNLTVNIGDEVSPESFITNLD